MTRINAATTSTPVRRPIAAAASDQAKVPALAAKAQAAATSKPTKFADLESYKAYVQNSQANGLPAARQALAEAKKSLDTATSILATKKQDVRHQPLQQALAKAEADLTAAQYPLRPQAARKTDEAKAVQAQVGGVMRELAEAQRGIAAAEGRKAARSRDMWFGDNSKDTGWDVAADVLGSLGDAGAVSSGNRKIKALIDRKVALEQQILTLTMEATALQHQPGEPAKIEAARAVRDSAQTAFDGATATLAAESGAVEAATRGVQAAQGGLDKLEGVKKELTDYGQQFGFFTRIKLKVSNWGWRKELDSFWQAKGL